MLLQKTSMMHSGSSLFSTTEGIPLRNSDILKSLNLGALENYDDKTTYAKMWEGAESDLERILTGSELISGTILVKDKAPA